MQQRPLGRSGLWVGRIGLGTMTWGVQNTESEAHEQLDYAIKERGVNFIDTASGVTPPRFSPRMSSGVPPLASGRRRSMFVMTGGLYEICGTSSARRWPIVRSS